jgi:hypothetical protein
MIQKTLIKTVITGLQQEIFTSTNKRITLRDNTSYGFHLHGIARAVNGADQSIFDIVGGVNRGVGVSTVTLINTLPIVPTMESGIAREIALLADIVNGALGVFVTGTGLWEIVIDLFPNPEYREYESDYQGYLDEMGSMIQDAEGKLTADDLDAILQKAVTDWGKDEPLKLRKKIQGNGTNSYILATILPSLWQWGHSDILSIEYPYGDNPKTLLKQDEYEIYDDGSAQDGSNIIIRFTNNTPQAGKYFVVEFSVQPILTDLGAPNFPNTRLNFSKITTLASAYACQRLATAYAQSIDASISADVVNYNDKSSKYTTLAKEYFKIYNRLVFGEESPITDVKAAMSQKEIVPVSKSGDSNSSSAFLFHGKR